MIFEQAQFNIKAPPPPPPMIQVAEFNQRLAEQRSQMMMIMVAATVASIPTGIWVKKKTKITSMWAVMPFGVFPLLGLRYLPTLYMLIPYGLGAALVYWMARDYADYMAITVMGEGGIETDVYPLDDEGRVILDVGPRHFDQGFMHVKKIELIDNRFPINFRFKGTLLRCVTIEGLDSIDETPDKITVQCAPALARNLSEADVIEKLQNQLADTRFKLIFMERALRSVVAHAVAEMEAVIEDALLDDVATLPEARAKVEEATEAMKQVLGETEQVMQEAVPVEASS